MTRKIAAIAMLLAALIPTSPAQQQNLFRTVFTNATSSGASAALPQQGQAMHNLTVIFPGAAAPVTGFIVRMEGSFNGSTWFPIGSDITSAQLSSTGVVFAIGRCNGVYPFERVNLVTPAIGHPMNIYYTGGIAPVPVVPITPAIPPVTFTGALSVTIPSNTPNVAVSCYDTTVSPATAFTPQTITVDQISYTVTATFLAAKTGYCSASPNTGGSTGASAGTPGPKGDKGDQGIQGIQGPIGPPGTGGGGSSIPTLSFVPTISGGHVLAMYDFHEGTGTTVHCVAGTTCSDLTVSGGTWSAMGYAAGSGSIPIPASLFNAAKTIVLVSTMPHYGGTQYQSFISCSGWNLITDQATNFQLYGSNIANGETNRLPPGVGSGFNWDLGQSRMISWVRGSNASTDPDQLYVDTVPYSYGALANGSNNSQTGCSIGSPANGFNTAQTTYLAAFLDYEAGTDVGRLLMALKQIAYAKAQAAGLDVRPLLVISGDSVPGGHTGPSTTNDLPTSIAQLLSPTNGLNTNVVRSWNVLNAAMQGNEISAEKTIDATYHQGDNAGSGYIPVYSPSSSYRFERLRHVVSGGESINTMSHGSTAANSILYHQQWTAARVQEGYDVILIADWPYTPGGSFATTYPATATVYTDLAANWRAYGASYLLDLTGVPQFQAQGSSSNPTYFYDNVHFSPTGQNVLAQYYKQAATALGIY